jgi:hypothetical protein
MIKWLVYASLEDEWAVSWLTTGAFDSDTVLPLGWWLYMVPLLYGTSAYDTLSEVHYDVPYVLHVFEEAAKSVQS